jgi:ABC-2 type transport system ATP-binding protein
MSPHAIEIHDLHKSYDDVEAVRGIDLVVEEGEVFALLGPNGAGKTTTVEIMEGFRQQTSGSVTVLGFDPARRERALRQQVGIVLQATGIDPFLTVAETIEMYRGYYPHPRPVDEVIGLVGLEEKREVKVAKLSGGQQRRLDVAIALAGDPSLLFLDEPTTGFDPSARRAAWEMVKGLQSLGRTVFLTTHYMDEAQYLANRVAVIAGGKIVAEGPPSTLGDRASGDSVVRFRIPAGAGAAPDWGQAEGDGDGTLEIRTADPTTLLHDMTEWALQQGIKFERLEIRRPTLEDVYLELTGAEVGS